MCAQNHYYKEIIFFLLKQQQWLWRVSNMSPCLPEKMCGTMPVDPIIIAEDCVCHMLFSRSSQIQKWIIEHIWLCSTCWRKKGCSERKTYENTVSYPIHTTRTPAKCIFESHASIDPQALKERIPINGFEFQNSDDSDDNDDDDFLPTPRFHETVWSALTTDPAQMFLSTALKYYLTEIGLLFQKNHDIRTAFDAALRVFGEKETFDMIWFTNVYLLTRQGRCKISLHIHEGPTNNIHGCHPVHHTNCSWSIHEQ